MFVNRAFNIALTVSLLWHLICISAVNIIALPGKFRVRELTSVSFLGPILEKTALDIMMANKPVAVRTDYEGDMKVGPSPSNIRDNTLLPQDITKKDIGKRIEDRMSELLSVSFRETKEVPVITSGFKKAAKPAPAKDSEITGPAAAREIFYKPPKPQIPERVSGSTPFYMELKFFVSAQGDVEEVIPVVSSGNAEIDLLGIRYLKGWKFTPSAGNADTEQWGRAKIALSR